MLPQSLASRGGFQARSKQGGWINLAIMGISALANASAKKKAEKAANAERAASAEVEAKQLQLAQNQDKRATNLFEHYQRNFQPREAAFVKEAFKPITADAEEAAAVADVRGSLASMRRTADANQRATGVNPASGAAQSLNAARDLEAAKIEAGARTRARNSVRDLNYNRQAGALALSNPNAAMPFAASAQSGIGQVASLAGARSRLADDYAYEAGSAFGESLGGLVDAGLNSMRNRPMKIGGVMDVPAPVRRDVMAA